jgi:hypothetical protein
VVVTQKSRAKIKAKISSSTCFMYPNSLPMFYSIPSLCTVPPETPPTAAVADAGSYLRNDIAMTAVSGTINHNASGGELVVVGWPIAGHQILVRVF